MRLKDAARAAAPPFLWDVIRLFRPAYRTYPSWEAAAAAAGSYDDRMVNEFRAARCVVPADLSGNAIRWLVEILPAPFDIVDYGGATGEVGAALQTGGFRGRYTVVENPTLVALMAGRGGATFTSTLPAASDVFYSSGTLQYLADPYGVLEQAFAMARRAVILKRNNFSERDVFRVHRSTLFENGSGDIPPGFANIRLTYPYRTIRESRVKVLATKHGFRLFSRTPETDGVTIPGAGVYGAQLVFVKQLGEGEVSDDNGQ